jgi:hypothetical protein
MAQEKLKVVFQSYFQCGSQRRLHSAYVPKRGDAVRLERATRRLRMTGQWCDRAKSSSWVSRLFLGYLGQETMT